MGWLITNTQYYLNTEMDMPGQVVDDIDCATVFPHKRQAENALKNMGKIFRRLGYQVTETDRPPNLRRQIRRDREPNALPACPEPEAETEDDPYDRLLDAQFYIRELNHFRTFISEIQKAKPDMEKEQIRAEQEVEDILHAAELYDLNEHQAYRLYQRLHEARLRRRRYKDAVLWITLINAAAPDRFLKDEPSHRIGTWNQRGYRPRALPELFEELIAGNTAK